MLLTENAVQLLKRGAYTGSMDINAVGKDDKGNEICYYANQFIWEENPLVYRPRKVSASP